MTTTATTYDRSHDQHASADQVSSMLERSQWLKRTSWGAILAGGVSAIGLQALLTVLGTAIGIASFAGQGTSADGVGTFAGIWWVISGTVSLLFGGIIVGRMISIPRNAELAVHGFTMWAVTAIFGFLFIWSSAGMVGTAGSETLDDTSLIQQASQTTSTNTASQIGSADQASLTDVQIPTAANVRETSSAMSWWTLVALLMGVGAAVGGTYIGSAPLGPQTRDDDRTTSKS